MNIHALSCDVVGIASPPVDGFGIAAILSEKANCDITGRYTLYTNNEVSVQCRVK